MADRRGLRILATTVAIAMALVGLALWRQHRGPWLAPDFALPDLDGQAVRLSGHRGQVVLVNLWATWCPPCREEMPSMETLYRTLKDRGFVLLAVSEDEKGAEAVRPFVAEAKVSFPVLLDPQGEVGRKYGVWGYPESFVVDREGRIIDRVIGPRDWASSAEVTRMEALLAAPVASTGVHGG